MDVLRRALVVAAALVPGVAGAQRPVPRQAPSPPAQVVRIFFDALVHERFVEAARLIDVDPLERSRRAMLDNLRHPVRYPRPTLEDFMRSNPEKPRAVAEYELAQAQLAQDRQPDYLSFEFANVHDTVTLAQMSPLETGARDERYLMRSAMEHSPECASTVPLAQAFDSLRRATTREPGAQVLGTITAGDTSYVVFRHPHILGDAELDDVAGARPSVLTLVRKNATWIIQPDEQSMRRFQGMIAALCDREDQAPDSLSLRKKPPL
ncbi:MAG TPA: hypothetical protein VFT29_06930 [Gemmatimonadaceae bacterium]|nr:hypothetical protein [Gemmatimonadaceae bacterium]